MCLFDLPFSLLVLLHLEFVALRVSPLVQQLLQQEDGLGGLDEDLGLAFFEFCGIDFAGQVLCHPLDKLCYRSWLRLLIIFGTNDTISK